MVINTIAALVTIAGGGGLIGGIKWLWPKINPRYRVWRDERAKRRNALRLLPEYMDHALKAEESMLSQLDRLHDQYAALGKQVNQLMKELNEVRDIAKANKKEVDEADHKAKILWDDASEMHERVRTLEDALQALQARVEVALVIAQTYPGTRQGQPAMLHQPSTARQDQFDTTKEDAPPRVLGRVPPQVSRLIAPPDPTEDS